jgi:cytochrome c peroxidase
MRATGRQLGNPVAELAQGLPTNPAEMGLPDIACAVYRASHHEPEGDRAFLQHARRPAAPPAL